MKPADPDQSKDSPLADLPPALSARHSAARGQAFKDIDGIRHNPRGLAALEELIAAMIEARTGA